MSLGWFLLIVVSGAGLFFAGYKVGAKKMETVYREQIKDVLVAAMSIGLTGENDGNS